jgi:cob(I)alamin adenosyltransferase
MAKQRISKVTTKAGDSGNTKLATGRSVHKGSDLVRAIGCVDELNSHVGMLVSLLDQEQGTDKDNNLTDLAAIQQALFDIGAVFAMEGDFPAPTPAALEERINLLNNTLPPLTEFVLPGGGLAAAQSHICRTVCRRAETDIWRLQDLWPELPDGLAGAAKYLNRLSDYFFILARTLTANGETQWQGPAKS